MRVLFCITDLEPGGAEQALVELVQRMPDLGIAPHVAVLMPPPQHAALWQRLQQLKIPCEFCHARRVWHVPRTAIRLARIFQQVRPELVQGMLHHGNVLAAWGGRQSAIPVLTGIRVAERRLNGHRLLMRWTDRWVNRHVCVSDDVAMFCRDSVGLDAEKLTVIPNGVDVARFSSARPVDLSSLGIAANRRLLISVGRLDPQKRPDWLIDRLATILPALADHDALLVGSGPMESRLRRQIGRLGLEGRVHLLGHRDDVPELLAAADVFLHAAAWEGMPNVVLEAMAARLPVVATECHGLAEVLGPLAMLPAHSAYQSVEAHDAASWEQGVIRFAQDRDLRASVGAMNVARVEQNFSWDSTAEQYARLYRSIIAGS